MERRRIRGLLLAAAIKAAINYVCRLRWWCSSIARCWWWTMLLWKMLSVLLTSIKMCYVCCVPLDIVVVLSGFDLSLPNWTSIYFGKTPNFRLVNVQQGYLLEYSNVLCIQRAYIIWAMFYSIGKNYHAPPLFEAASNDGLQRTSISTPKRQMSHLKRR